MRIRFLAAARKEFSEAVSYYDSKEPGLGDEFADEVWKTISRIASHPSAWQQLSSRTRRCLTKRFPYAVIFRAETKLTLDHRRDAFETTSRQLAGQSRERVSLVVLL